MSATRFVRMFACASVFCALLLPAASGTEAEEQTGDAGRKGNLSEQERIGALERDVTQGALRVVKEDGSIVECPLRHTDVQADVAGFIARVTVTQTFYNPTDERIEAVYVFPLPHEAAVDAMTMVIGERRIVGVVKRRAEAKQIYEQALAAGQTAALLEQERPNIFTQTVGNIEPAQEVNIEISYVDVLDYDMGTYEFHFPMVVGPRFIPGARVRDAQPTPPELQGKVSPPVPDTTRVPDASRITPPVLRPGHRNGHDISLSLQLDAGVPIQGLAVANHEAEVVRNGKQRAEVTLSQADSIPNKDFVFRYHVVGKKPEMAVLAHTGSYTDARRLGRGYFLLMIQPQEDERLTKSPPREIVFLLDVSGSMSGEPTEKVKEAMRDMLELCRPVDTLQVITFAGSARQLFDKPVPVNQQNVATALNFTQAIRGSGGTHMLQGIKKAIDQPVDPERVRIVIMLTDGYIGNEAEIIEHVGKNCGDQIRFWAIGIGSSPNMFLVDGVARQGGGMGKRLGLKDTSAGLAEEVITRIQRAQLAKIRIDWGGLNVAETYPAKVPELWAGRPVILLGRYTGGGAAEIKVNGRVEGESVSWPLRVSLPEKQPGHDALAKVWARRKIEDLMHQTYYLGSPAVEEEVTAIALDYRLMSQYTSFVAVDAKDADGTVDQQPAQPPRRMLVPVPLPEGTRWEGFFGPLGEQDEAYALASQGDLKAGRSLTFERFYSYRGKQQGLGMGGFGGGLAGRPTRASHPTPASSRPLLAKSPYVDRLQRQAGAPSTALRRSRGVSLSSAPYPRSFGLAPAPSAGTTLRLFRQPVSRKLAESAASVADDAALLGQAIISDGAYAVQALGGDTEQIVTAAQQFLAAGRRHRQANRPDQARSDLVRAYFLAAGAANRGAYQAVPTADQAMTELETLHTERVADWQEQEPAFATRLELVLRDVSVDRALQAVAQASGLQIHLAEGSIQDAEEMLAGGKARVTYLDLRGATAAQALDWILQPLRLTWQPQDDADHAAAILVGSDRRLPGSSAWVYDVSSIAVPLADEFKGLDNRDELISRVRQDAGQFLDNFRQALKASQQEATWFAPGQLLVFGDPDAHQRTAEIITQLSDPEASPAGPLAELHATTSQRAEQRRDRIRKIRELNRLEGLVSVHDQFSWKLLAAAFGGELDDQALTELRIAWNTEETRELLDRNASGYLLRSGWSIIAASQMLPEHTELSSLADLVRNRCGSAAEEALGALKDKPQDLSTVLAAAYAALTMKDSDLNARVLGALPADVPAGSAVAGAVLAARGLLGEPQAIDAQRLASLFTTDNITGEDLTVLVALACRRAGGETWAAFRADMRDLLGQQPLPGSVVVLINRLSGNASRLARK